MIINKTIKLKDYHDGGPRGSIQFASNDPSDFMNVYLNDICGSPCVSPASAKELRDALIEAYPVEAVQAKPEISVEWSSYTDRFTVFKKVMVEELQEVAECKDEDDANRIKELLSNG